MVYQLHVNEHMFPNSRMGRIRKKNNEKSQEEDYREMNVEYSEGNVNLNSRLHKAKNKRAGRKNRNKLNSNEDGKFAFVSYDTPGSNRKVGFKVVDTNKSHG